MSFISNEELKTMGFKHIGENVKISDTASIYGHKHITMGDHSRIDDFCILSAGEGGIFLGEYVHIACYTSLIGAEKIILEDFTGISSKSTILSSNDDYSGEFLTNPTVPQKYTNVSHAPVLIKKHALIGTGVTILPGITIEEGSVVGALSLVKKDTEPFAIYFGAPAKKIKNRKKDLLTLEKELKNSHNSE